jgi:hypothetical protein
MLLVYLTDGECVEVEQAVRVGTKSGSLFCYSASGKELASFPLESVELYTFDEREAKVITDEACEEVTVVGEHSGQSQSGA